MHFAFLGIGISLSIISEITMLLLLLSEHRNPQNHFNMFFFHLFTLTKIKPGN